MKYKQPGLKTLYSIFQVSAVVSALFAAHSAHALEGFTIDSLAPLEKYAGKPADINDAGIVVGSAADRYVVDRPVSWDNNNQVTLLPTNTGSEINDFANAINEAGEIVGERVRRPALWINEEYIPLGGTGYANDINDNGLIVGRTFSSLGHRATLWDNLRRQLLGGEPENAVSEAKAVNSQGQVVGNFKPTSISGAGAAVPVIWEANGSISLLGTLPVAIGDTKPNDINDDSLIVGTSGNRAVLWSGNLIADLGALGGGSSQALAINNAGQIVGSTIAEDGTTHAFLWQDGVMYDLAPALEQNCTVGQRCISIAYGINELGQVVIHSFDDDGPHAIKLTIAAGALNSLPNISVPLDFMDAVGAGPLDGGAAPAVIEADLAISSFNQDLVGLTRKGREIVKFNADITNNGQNGAENVKSTLIVSGQLGNVRKVNGFNVKKGFSNCIHNVSGTRANRTVTVRCEHRGLAAGDTVSNSVELVVRNPDDVNAEVSVSSDTFDPAKGNNAGSL